MIIVDTSAIIAIDLREPNHASLFARIVSRTPRFMPATAMVEATMVLSRLHKDPKAVLDRYISSMSMSLVPIDAEIVAAAQDAFLRFGKGRHPARLNLCDCFSYAVAKVMNAPLLFVGNDFAQTDIAAL
ncbi:MAG: type II toxin-antitoxin system VapC family toxin [Rhizomicrobium sp.]